MQRIYQIAAVVTGQQLALGGAIRVAERDAHQKAVKLRFRQRIGAQLVVRVLRGNHKKRRGQGAGFAFDGDLFFFHRLQQRALSFWAGAVDLVSQQHLRKNRSWMKHKRLFAALVNRHAGEVTGHQVGGELHPGELQPKGLCQRVCQGGLANAGHVLNQQVTPGQQAGHAVLCLLGFADDHRVKLIHQRFEFWLRIHRLTLPEIVRH